MHSKTKIKSIKRTNGISQCFVQGFPTGKLPNGYKEVKNPIKTNNLFFNLTANPILCQNLVENFKEVEIRQFASLMVDATRKFTGNIDSWIFSKKDSLQDLILRCGNRLRSRVDIDHIDVYTTNDGMCLSLKKFIGSRSKTYCINLKPIFMIKNKNKRLYNILLSFVKSLPFDSIFDTDVDRVDWLWTYQFEELAYSKEVSKTEYLERLKGSIGFFMKYERIYNAIKCEGWKSSLEPYNPKKSVYKEIKELLLTADEVDFNAPFRISVRDGYECMMEHSHTFLIIDEDDSEFTHSYIQMLNENSNEYDIISVYADAVVKKGIIESFEENINYELSKVENFICDLNDLIKKV